MRKLSVSQVNKYLRCPRLWYIHYIQKNWPKEKAEALCFGIAFHEGIEAMLQAWESESALAIGVAQFENSYKEEWKSPTAKKIKDGKTMLEALYENLRGMDFVPLVIEKFANVPGFCGKIDCIAEVNGKRVVIDWKSSTGKYSEEKVLNDIQLTAYSWLIPDHEKIAFVVVNKRNYEVQWCYATRTKKEIEDFVKSVDMIRAEMAKHKSMPEGVHTPRKCQMWGKDCDAWEGGFCRGLGDF